MLKAYKEKYQLTPILDPYLRIQRALNVDTIAAVKSDARLVADAGFGDKVKVAYCRMLRKYWLQKGDTIQNPFYGKQMSDCGRIAATMPGQK